MKKMLISPFMGTLPAWIDKYRANCAHLKASGWDVLIPNDLTDFEKRIRDTLGLNPTIPENTCKVSDFRPALGLLYADILKDYEFWGYTDLDCVYGDLSNFLSDEELAGCDMFVNDYDTNVLCGPFTLYRNNEKMNNLFRDFPGWQALMENPNHHAFDEQGMGVAVRNHPELRVIRKFSQGHSAMYGHDDIGIGYKDGKLYDHGEEIMLFHFNRHKVWPI